MKQLAIIFFFLLAAAASAQEVRSVIDSAIDSYSAGDYEEALSRFNAVIDADLEEVKANRWLYYSINYYAGYCAKITGNHSMAEQYLSVAISIASELNIVEQVPTLYMLMAETLQEAGKYYDADSYYNLAQERVTADSSDSATIWYLIADTRRQAKQFAQAAEAGEKALEISSLQSFTRLEIMSLTLLGEIYSERGDNTKGDHSNAIRIFTQSLTLAKNAQLPLETANSNMGIAIVYQSLEKNDLARQHYDEALKHYTICMDNTNIAMIVNRLVSLPPCSPSQALRAVEGYLQYAETFARINDHEHALLIMKLAVHHQIMAERPADTVETFRRIFSMATMSRLTNEAVESALSTSEILFDSGWRTEAFEILAEAQMCQDSLGETSYIAAIYGKRGYLYEKNNQIRLAEFNYQIALESSLNEDERAFYAEAVFRMQQQPEAW